MVAVDAIDAGEPGRGRLSTDGSSPADDGESVPAPDLREAHPPETHPPEDHLPETHPPEDHLPEDHLPEDHLIDPALRAAERAFERGDFFDAANRARRLSTAEDERTRISAIELLGRFRNDPVVIVLMAAALVGAAMIIAHYLGH